MAEPQRLTLAHIREMGEMTDALYHREFLLLAAAAQGVLQFEGDAEMVLDGGLASPSDQHQALNPGPDGLFHDVLDDGRVHQRQHFLGLGLGRGQEAGAQARDGNDGFA